MSGLSGLLFVRDYIYAPQCQQNTYVLAQENDRQGEPSFMESNEACKLRYGRQLVDDIVVRGLSRNSRDFPSLNACLTKNRTSTPADLIENPLDPNEYRSQIHKQLAQYLDLPRALKAQSESSSSLKSNNASSSLPLIQPNKTEYHINFKHLQDQGSKSTGINSPSKAQLSPPRQVSPLSPVVKNRGRAPSQAVQSVSKFRRLSPLRESSDIVDRNAELEQQNLIVQKTRKPLQPLLHTSEPFDRLCKSQTPDRACKLFLSRTSSFPEDYTNNTAFLGTHRKLSSPELRGSLYHSQLVSRTASVGSLRHLPPDKGRALYIGVNAHIFLPPRQHRTSNETVKYLKSPRKERQIPALTPYAILPSHKFGIVGSMSPTKVARAGPTPAIDSTGSRWRSSSDVSNVGSEYSEYSYRTMVEDAEISESSIMDPAAEKRRGQVFDDVTLAVLLREEAQRDGFPVNMQSLMSIFQVSFSNPTDKIQISPHAEQTGVYITSFDGLSTLEVVSVSSETGFHDKAGEAVPEKRVNFMPDVQVSSTPSGNHSTIDSESFDREDFWAKLRNLFAGCFSTR